MRTINIITYLLPALITTAASAYEAHEWGTFTSLVGSDGRTQNGMYHEDEPLPSFVYKFGETRRDNAGDQPPRPRPPEDDCFGKGCFGRHTIDNNILTQKMETPVIYFYANSNETPLNVNVNVRFPEGVITESYPGPVATSPQRSDDLVLANGNTTYSIQVLNRQHVPFAIPTVEPGNIYGYARNVASNVIRSGSEHEKFIFYRGLGRFQPRIQISSRGRSLSINSPRTSIAQGMFLVNVTSSGVATGMRVGTLGQVTLNRTEINALRAGPNGTNIMNQSGLRDALISSLVDSGLRVDEATAMLDTWESGYLRVPGLRLLYILPRNEVADVLPVTMTPAPQNFVRSFVARIEVMLDEEERDLVFRIQDEGSNFSIASLGRFAEPMLRRAREVAPGLGKIDPGTLALIDRLILQASQTPSAPGGVN